MSRFTPETSIGKPFDFIIKKFPLSESFQTIKETISLKLNIELEEINKKYKLYYLDALQNRIPLTIENDIKLIFSILHDNGLNKIKLILDEDEEEITENLNENFEYSEHFQIKSSKKKKKIKRIFKVDKANSKSQCHLNDTKEISDYVKKRGRGRPRKGEEKSNKQLKSKETTSSRTIRRRKRRLKSFVYRKSKECLGESNSKSENSVILKRRGRKRLRRHINTFKKLSKSSNCREDIVEIASTSLKITDNPVNQVKRKYRYKNNVKSDESKIEKWFLQARFNLRQYKKTDDRSTSYVITYEGKNKVKIQFRIRGPDKKFHCRGKLVNFYEDGYDEKWDNATGCKKMEKFLNHALDNFEKIEKNVYLHDF